MLYLKKRKTNSPKVDVIIPESLMREIALGVSNALPKSPYLYVAAVGLKS